ncbi:MAG: hypothetical protein NVS9B15_23730 [Acidobacteriaceae bacterium]
MRQQRYTDCSPKRCVDTESGKEYNDMPLYLDVHHKIEGLTQEGIEHAHQMDLEVQDKYGVKYLRYWFDVASGRVYCLVDAPDAGAAAAVHKEAHGHVADEINEVSEGS